MKYLVDPKKSVPARSALLAEDGWYVVRRPAIEASLDRAPTNSGGRLKRR